MASDTYLRSGPFFLRGAATARTGVKGLRAHATALHIQNESAPHHGVASAAQQNPCSHYSPQGRLLFARMCYITHMRYVHCSTAHRYTFSPAMRPPVAKRSKVMNTDVIRYVPAAAEALQGLLGSYLCRICWSLGGSSCCTVYVVRSPLLLPRGFCGTDGGERVLGRRGATGHSQCLPPVGAFHDPCGGSGTFRSGSSPAGASRRGNCVCDGALWCSCSWGRRLGLLMWRQGWLPALCAKEPSGAL